MQITILLTIDLSCFNEFEMNVPFQQSVSKNEIKRNYDSILEKASEIINQ